MSKSDFGFYSPNNAPEGCESMEVLRWLPEADLLRRSLQGDKATPKQTAPTKKRPRSRSLVGGHFGVCFIVEPQRIELWSREDNAVPSTCLVDIYCREKQGYQHPKPFLSYCVLSALSNITRSSSALRHR